MGASSVKAQSSQLTNNKQPLFGYPNMVKLITKTQITSDYQILQNIGKGSFAEVFKGRCLKSKKIRAIKKIDKRKNPKMSTILLNQFDILRQMDHPNILKMFGLYEQYSNFYIVTQLCQGKQLFQVIAQKKIFKEADAAAIFHQLCSAVKHLHQHKVMHRDLKPENIIYDEKQQTLKLVDFGSALKFDDSKPIERRRVGTSYYISPQVLTRCYNQKCDVWSAGIILYILLFGQPPFKGNNDDEILKQVQKGQIQFSNPVWHLFSAEAKDLLKKMLQKDFQKRISMHDVMNHLWFENQLKLTKQSNKKSQKVNQKNLAECLNNMKLFQTFNHSNTIQQGVLIFIINFIQNHQDETQLLKCFKAMDLNGDGVLSLHELQIAMSKYLKISQKQALIFAKKIFQKVDKNNSGQIDYSQFLVSAVNIQIVISQDNLDMAFDYMDHDKSETLSVIQIRQKLGQNVSEQMYRKLIKQFDTDKDGQISRNQFKGMMKKILNNSNSSKK